MQPRPRELECLRAVLQHSTQKEAAWALGISRHTLRNHLASLRKRLGVETTLQAVERLNGAVQK